MRINRRYTNFILLICLLVMAGMLSNLHSQEVNDVRVRNVKISGNDHFSNGYIRSHMDTGGKRFYEFWKRSPVFDEALLERDTNRIIRMYQREGFLNVTIDEQSVELDDKGKWAKIRIRLDEGVRVKVGNITFQFTDQDKSLFEDQLVRLRRNLTVTQDSYFSDDDFKADLQVVREHFDKLGYPYIKVYHFLVLSFTEEFVTIMYMIELGPKATIGEITFTGLRKIEEHQLKRFLTVKTGDPYIPHRLDQTRSRLHDLGVFQFVSVNLLLDSVKEEVPVEINVRENFATRLDFGAGLSIEDIQVRDLSLHGFSFEESFRVYAEISRLRFLGGLRKGTLFIKHSYYEPIVLDFKLQQPGIPTVHSNAIFNPFYRREREPGYRIDRIGGSATLNYRISRKTATYITYTFEDNKLTDSAEFTRDSARDLFDDTSIDNFEFYDEQTDNTNPLLLMESEPVRNYRKSSVTWGIIRDSSRPAFFPRHGSLISNTLTFSGLGFGSDFRYLGMLSEVRHYYPLINNLVFAGRIKAGAIKGLADEEYIPIEDRYYAGGSFSVRGWGRRQLGPKSDDDKPLGGKALLEGSLELRNPIIGQLSGVIFLDYGNVWVETFDHDLTDIKYAAGAGLRFATPVGPIRLDIGTPILEGIQPVQFFISLGQAF